MSVRWELDDDQHACARCGMFLSCRRHTYVYVQHRNLHHRHSRKRDKTDRMKQATRRQKARPAPFLGAAWSLAATFMQMKMISTTALVRARVSANVCCAHMCAHACRCCTHVCTCMHTRACTHAGMHCVRVMVCTCAQECMSAQVQASMTAIAWQIQTGVGAPAVPQRERAPAVPQRERGWSKCDRHSRLWKSNEAQCQ